MRIVLIAAESLDGFITKHAEPGTAFTSPEDKAYFRAALADFDAGIFGGETYRVSREFIRDRLPGLRLRLIMTRSPERYAADAISGALEFTDADPAALAAMLRTRGIRRCALLGGSHVHSLFFEAGLVDEVWLTVEPVLFGRGTPLLARRADVRLELEALEKLGAHALLLKYHVPR
ncbi:MAG TPA: dihydrofolate reductase family protein [Opitutaceae bacterium]|nr:dihydrofolate reductase family protein [Opitutaceae bacterium]